MPTPCFCSHKFVLGEVDENVHLIILHNSENRADVVILQHRAIIVQDGAFGPAEWSIAVSSSLGK